MSTVKTRLGDVLVEQGVISERQLETALAKQKENPKPRGEVLIEMGMVKESELAHTLADQLDISYVDLLSTALQPNAVDLVPEHLARKYKCIPVRIENGHLYLAMCDPMDLDALEEISTVTKLEVRPLISTREDILESIELQYFTRNYRITHARKLETEIWEDIKEDKEPAKEARIFAIISNKGGVGKTHTSINLACAFSSMKMKTLLIDIDLGNANVGVKIGLHPKDTLMDFLNKEKEIFDIVTKTSHGFDFIGGQSGEYKLANLAYVQKLKFIRNFREVSKNYDVVVFDLSAGIDSTVLDFALAADEVIIVTTPQDIVAGYACLKASYYRFKDIELRLEKKMKNYQAKLEYAPKFIINQADARETGQNIFGKITATANKHFGDGDRFKLNIGYLGFIPYDRETFRQTEKRRKPYVSAFPDSMPTKCLRFIASELLKPPLLRQPMSAGEKPAQGTTKPIDASSKSVREKSNFRRFAEILRMKV
jgi:flagellar biosynthesis protein FlhG